MSDDRNEWKSRAEQAEAEIKRLQRRLDEQAGVSAKQFVRAMREKSRAEQAEARLAKVVEHQAAHCPDPIKHLPHVWYDRTRTELPFEFSCSGENASSDA